MLEFYLSLVEDPRDKEKIVLIYEKCRDYMMYRAYENLKNKNEAEDAVHESFLKIIRIIKRVRTDDADELRNFCGKVAENTARSMNRKNSIRESEYIDGAAESAKLETPEDVMLRKETYLMIEKAVEEMDPEDRDVFTFKYVYGFGNKEIAEFLNMNYNNVCSIAMRAKKAVIDKLKETAEDE